jgi:hypothetical protein
LPDTSPDGELGVGAAEFVGDDLGVEAEVEQHPARSDVAQIVGRPFGGAGPAPALVGLPVARNALKRGWSMGQSAARIQTCWKLLRRMIRPEVC